MSCTIQPSFLTAGAIYVLLRQRSARYPSTTSINCCMLMSAKNSVNHIPLRVASHHCFGSAHAMCSPNSAGQGPPLPETPCEAASVPRERIYTLRHCSDLRRPTTTHSDQRKPGYTRGRGEKNHWKCSSRISSVLSSCGKMRAT